MLNVTESGFPYSGPEFSALLVTGSAPSLSSVVTVMLAATSPLKSPVVNPVSVITVTSDTKMLDAVREITIEDDEATAAFAVAEPLI
jgi:hypothetical protein